jgi:cysteine sulfinate desulfinase/cysteine desulfurase-like protein
VLAAMGVPLDRARGALRFTLGSETSDDDIAEAIASFGRAVSSLRA